MRVFFPRRDLTVQFSADDHAFTPLRLREGADPARWSEEFHLDLVERLATLDVDALDAWRNRIDGLALASLREAGGLGSFLGGRIRLFPHQLHVAEQATKEDPVRWLLADEVGLGKTVEACLVLNRLVRTGRAERVLVVAPSSLTVQWLGELYRKFHQTFVLLDEARLRDVERDFGRDWNPFDVHARVIVSMEDLVHLTKLAQGATQAAPDLVIIDEAHRLERRKGHPGSPTYRTLAPIARAARHLLLLSATPLETDAHGFYRLLELVRPDLYPSWEEFHRALEDGNPVVACASSTRREDIGGLPPRVPAPVALPPAASPVAAEQLVLESTPGNVLERKRRAEALERLWARPWGDDDPRLAWILAEEPAWRSRGEKILVFVHELETLHWLKKRIEGATFRRVGVFHEELSPAARDLEVAEFASALGPTVLVSTEAGGEGRNFEFCRGLVHFDLPWDPMVVEQRIGRLDRISRERPVEIMYFVPAEGFGRQVAELYHALGVFREPLGGLDRSLASVHDAVFEASMRPRGDIDTAAVVADTLRAREQMHRALYRNLHRERYRPELGDEILARVPAGLEPLVSRVVREACHQYGFEIVEKAGVDTWYVEFGGEATVSSLHGVAEGARWLGTFDRAHAVERETLDFFASGHPLVEAVLGEIEDGKRGEVCLLEIADAPVGGVCLWAILKTGSRVRHVALDLRGVEHGDWAEHILSAAPSWRAADAAKWSKALAAGLWAEAVREILQPLQAQGRLFAVAGVRLLPAAIGR